MSHKFFGLDISLNHMGICCLSEDGKLERYNFLTDIKKFETQDPGHGVWYSVPSARSDHRNHFLRIKKFIEYTISIIAQQGLSTDAFVAVEGYALNTKNTRLYETAELTGNVKSACWSMGCKLRVHDPDSVKMFAVDNGHAKKDMIYDQFVEETLIDPEPPIQYYKQGGRRELGGPGTDVADAYFLARLLWMEHQLRTGTIRLQDLPAYKQRVFVRETKTYPKNLLEREYA